MSTQLGEQIANTNLVRQWQGKFEVYPRYFPPRKNMSLSEMLDEAFEQARNAGFKGVNVDRDLYVYHGEWYIWAFPPSREAV